MEEALRYLIDEGGLLGVVLAFSILANVHLYRRNQQLLDKAIEDARVDRTEMISALKDSNKALDQNTSVLSRRLTDA